MRLRHWLLIGSSVSLMTVAPAGITVAQDAGENAGLTDACVAAGITTPEDCTAFEKQLTPEQAAPQEQAPTEEAAPPAEKQAPAEEPAPPAAEEQAPAEEAAPEQPAPTEEAAPQEPAPAEQAAPQEEPAPTEEQAAPPVEEQQQPAPEQPAAEQPAPEEQQAPADQQAAPDQQQAPAEETAPEQPAPAEEAAPEQQPAEQAAPTEEQQPAEQAPAEQAQPAPAEEQAAPEQQQPAPTQEEQPQQEQAPAAEGTVDISADLQAAASTYQDAVAGLIEAQTGGGDVASAQASVSDAQAQIDALCSQGGFASTDECLAQYGVTLPQVPAGTTAPSEEQPVQQTEEQAQPAEEQPATEQPATPPSPEQVQEELQNSPVLQDQPKEEVTDLPEGVSEDEVAPLLDSAKDEVTAIESGTETAQPPVEGQQPAEGQEQQPQPEQPAAPPESDAAAQAPIEVQAQEVKTMEAEQGEPLEAPPPIEVPQNVTVVNNNTTVVNNNTTVNNTTNNVDVDNTAIVVDVGNHYVISNPQQDRARVVQPDDEVYYEQLSRGRVRETIEKPDGSKVITVRNRYGEVLQRSRITPDGREYILAYYNPRAEQDDEQVFYGDVGADLPPLRLTIPIDQYVLDASTADEDQLQTFLAQPPVEQVRRLYTIAEVKHSARIRDTVRRLELGDLTFDTGEATIARDQVDELSDVAKAMQALLNNNPAETFLIEGHTDAVGSDLSNLRLSDQRADTVAKVLTDFYGIPPENLVTQGYGERYLKIRTQEAERENRRVTIRRITPLITPVASR